MNRIHFLFGVHNHQPIGNFDFVFEKAYAMAYLPFFDAMERHPKLRWNLHATGILWEWLDKHHPEYVDRVAEAVKEGRIEILTGGYYEPILPALPDRDKAGQISKLSKYIRQRFKSRPKGMWLAERVWEPHLTKVLADCGVEYTLVDDTHFLTSGMTQDQMTGAYLTEEQGATLRVLPIRKDLRYSIPFRDPGETLSVLRNTATASGHRALVMLDDGEKFGLWPDTQEHVYREAWLEKFLTVLESNSDWISCSRISDYLGQYAPQGRVYLPTSSYHEMGEWALPAASQAALSDVMESLGADKKRDAAKPFLRGGFWRNFLTKYEESNNLHKKMLFVAGKVHRAVDKLSVAGAKSAGKAQKMLDALWAGQCNCAYWHGVFGGLYLPHLRQALYRQLLSAESLADAVLSPDGVQVSTQDFDKDGRDEVLIEAREQNLYVAPAEGGSLFEWDLRSKGINLGNVLTRRIEAYHKQLLERGELRGSASDSAAPASAEAVRVKESKLETKLFSDWYRRTSLLDHFLHPDTTIEEFYRCQYGEQGDFIRTGYRTDIVKGKHPQVRLFRTGTVWSGEQRNSILIEKTISLAGPMSWQVVYRLQNTQGPACALQFACELAFGFAMPTVQEPVVHVQKSVWSRKDEAFGFQVKLELDFPSDLWEFPLHTVSLSEEGMERTYQGTVLTIQAPIELKPGQALTRTWRVGASS